nr:adenylyl-sulfate kinase [Gloeobacter violaceus]
MCSRRTISPIDACPQRIVQPVAARRQKALKKTAQSDTISLNFACYAQSQFLEEEQHPMGKGVTLWFTGLSGAGKSTISGIVAKKLQEIGRNVEVLDGDEVRLNLSAGLSFSKADRDTNVRRIGYVCRLLSRNGVIAISAAISPYRNTREELRANIIDFLEIFVDCPLDVCIERDVKGLYAKALKGEIPAFTGVSDPYEAPANPDLTILTNTESKDESANRVVQLLYERGYL